VLLLQIWHSFGSAELAAWADGVCTLTLVHHGRGFAAVCEWCMQRKFGFTSGAG
jgi:hypothetical protein